MTDYPHSYKQTLTASSAICMYYLRDWFSVLLTWETFCLWDPSICIHYWMQRQSYDHLTTHLVPRRILINILQKPGVPTSSLRNQSPYSLDNIIWRFFLKLISKDFRWTKNISKITEIKKGLQMRHIRLNPCNSAMLGFL